MTDFTHMDQSGRAKMVDISEKPTSSRFAKATASVLTTVDITSKIRDMQIAKGPVLEVARIAGIQAAKKTSELIPLCHPLPIDDVSVSCELADGKILIEASVRTFAKTGVEMEALTAVSVAALTVYDMCKAIDRSITISEIKLVEKSGGKSGDYFRI